MTETTTGKTFGSAEEHKSALIQWLTGEFYNWARLLPDDKLAYLHGNFESAMEAGLARPRITPACSGPSPKQGGEAEMPREKLILRGEVFFCLDCGEALEAQDTDTDGRVIAWITHRDDCVEN